MNIFHVHDYYINVLILFLLYFVFIFQNPKCSDLYATRCMYICILENFAYFVKNCTKFLYFIAVFLYFQPFQSYFGISIRTKRQISLSSLVRLVRNSRLTLLLLGYFEFLKSILVFPSRLFWIISIF